MTKKRNIKIEESFRKMLNNSPKKICLNAINLILDEFKKDNIDITNMQKMVKEKIKNSQTIILPLPKIK